MINRGNYRQAIFAGKGAAEAFERCLGETGARFQWRVHAFVVMRNHSERLRGEDFGPKPRNFG